MKSCGVFIGLKISAATPRRRALRSGETCLCSSEACLRSGEACLRSGEACLRSGEVCLRNGVSSSLPRTRKWKKGDAAT